MSVTKLSARMTYKNLKRGDFESIIAYKERFNAALKAYYDQKNPKMEDGDTAMDFFCESDNARYVSFKGKIINGLTAGPQCYVSARQSMVEHGEKSPYWTSYNVQYDVRPARSSR